MRSAATLQRLAPAFVVLAAVLVYLNSLGSGFAFDDVPIIQHNGSVHNLAAWRDIWLAPYWPYFGSEFGLYRPFIIFLYAVQWSIGGGAAWVFHAGNVLLHGVATLLAFLVLDRLTGRMPAVVGALLFALHPVHTEAVANVVGQAEVVAAIALFGAALVHISRPAGAHVSWPRRLALVALFGLGLATKESAVILPALLVALDFAQRRVSVSARGLVAYTHAMLLPLFLLAATLALYLIVRYDVLSGSLIGVNAAPALPFLQEEHRVLNALRAFPEFLRLLVFPRDLAIDYGPGVLMPVESLTPMTVLGGLMLIALTGLALATPWSPAVGLPAAWFLISIFTVSNLFFPVGVLVAERTLYAPSFAVSLALAFAWRHAPPHLSPVGKRLAPALIAVALALMAARTWARNPDWASTHAVATRFTRDHPESYRAQWDLASLAWQHGLIEEAELRFRLAYRLYPRDPQLLLDYGSFLVERARTEEAVKVLEASYELRRFAPGTVMLLAHVYVRHGRWHDALARIPEAEAFGIDRTITMPVRAHAYAGLGQYHRAAGAWRVAAAHARTDSWVFASFLARSLAVGGYEQEAVTTVLQARQSATDPVGQKTLERVAAAIGNGCYEAVRASPPHPPSYPPCDPLGDYFTFATRAAQAQRRVPRGEQTDSRAAAESLRQTTPLGAMD